MLALALLLFASDALLIPAGRAAPYLEGKTLEGSSWGAELTGQVTIVEFFASWCPHCRRSLASYPALLAERPVQIIIVNVEEEPAVVQEFFSRNPPPGRAGILLDTDGQIKRRWGVSGVPAVFLIDQTGTVRESFAGWGNGSAGRLARKIDALNKPPLVPASAAAPAASAAAPDVTARRQTKPTRGSRRQAPQKLPAARPVNPDERARQLGVEVLR